MDFIVQNLTKTKINEEGVHEVARVVVERVTRSLTEQVSGQLAGKEPQAKHLAVREAPLPQQSEPTVDVAYKALQSKEELSLVFVNAERMQNMNKAFRNKDYVTDVLSFAGYAESLGELVFCLEKMKEQAHENDHNLEDEFLYLLIHGLLHLLGYDHELGTANAEEMFRIQDEAFAALRPVKEKIFA